MKDIWGSPSSNATGMGCWDPFWGGTMSWMKMMINVAIFFLSLDEDVEDSQEEKTKALIVGFGNCMFYI